MDNPAPPLEPSAHVAIHFPTMLRQFTGGNERVVCDLPASGATLRVILDELETRFPGLSSHLLDSSQTRLRPGLAAAVNSRMIRSQLCELVPAGAEIHFLPAVGGG